MREQVSLCGTGVYEKTQRRRSVYAGVDDDPLLATEVRQGGQEEVGRVRSQVLVVELLGAHEDQRHAPLC